MTFRHHWRPDFCTPACNRLKLKLSWNKKIWKLLCNWHFCQLQMPRYDTANNKHNTLVQWNFYKGNSKIHVHLYSFPIHATKLQDCPLACTVLHAQSQVYKSKQSFLLWLGAWTWFGAWGWFGLGTATWLWTATAMAPAPTAAAATATGPAIKNWMWWHMLLITPKPAEIRCHCSEHVGKFTTCDFRPERSHHSNDTGIICKL